MELKFWLNDSLIEEPVGFDAFRASIERTEHHGISAEVSVGSLEFYGVAVNIIRYAYQADIDTELLFRVDMKCEDEGAFVEIYSGVLDLATYEEYQDEYCSVKCKVGEIGVRTTFNNRVDTDVYLNSLKSMDGVDLDKYVNLDKKITVPGKEILIGNKGKTSEIDITVEEWLVGVEQAYDFDIIIGFDNVHSELGDLNESYMFDYVNITNNSIPTLSNIKHDITNLRISYNLSIGVNVSGNTRWGANIVLYRKDGSSVIELHRGASVAYNNTKFKTVSSSYDAVIEATSETQLYLHIHIVSSNTNKGQTVQYNVVIPAENTNTLKITALTQIEDSTAKVSLVHEALSRTSEIISGLKVKSDWYKRGDSLSKPTDLLTNALPVGGGALKCITNGLKLRQAVLTDGGEPYLFMSFKSLFQALDAIDNIGWGFSVESGNLVVRVEPWRWFYKADVVLEIEDAKAISREVDSNRIFSTLKIGYSKYSDIEDMNAIDSFHTERTYTNGMKAISNEKEKLCKFIADPYAIEFTRRKALDKTTEDWRFDNDVFIMAMQLIRTESSLEGGVVMPGVDLYSVDMGMEQTSDTMISPETMINGRISPQRNAMRWADSIFTFNNGKAFKLTSGTGNINAKGKPISVEDVHYLDDSGVAVQENDELQFSLPLLKAELLKFDYPLSFTEYNLIKSNPYGIIRLNGEDCYLKKIEYSLMEGLASFELIPKN